MHLPCSKLRPLILRARGQGCVMCSVVLRFLALMIVAAAVLQSPVTQASSARRRSLQSLRLEDVNCGCGRNMTQKCQRKVSCVANFSKRRPRRVSVNLLYRFAAKKSRNGGRRKRRGGQKYFRLKASARRKRSIKGYQDPSPRTRNPEITSCDEWSPSIKTVCVGEGKLRVEFGPENPLAESIEVGLHEGINSKQMDTKYTQGNTSCTFENLQSGNYSVTLRPRSPNCYGVLPFRSEIIHVNGKRSRKERHGSENGPEAIPLGDRPTTDGWTQEDEITSGHDFHNQTEPKVVT
ncbi:uncharacterized protein [Littorina saxatilis]|uniref:uncharacterized protein isoform X2 n=1 Tax=Littorina saxatilis TaxID=31220 RepID=UPI0038B5D14C